MREINVSRGNPIRFWLDNNGNPQSVVCHWRLFSSYFCGLFPLSFVELLLTKMHQRVVWCIPVIPFYSSENHMHLQSATPHGNFSCFIVPSRLHKLCAGIVTAQWGIGRREKLQCGGMTK